MTGICDLNRKTYSLKKIFKSNIFHEVPMGINKDYTLSFSSMSKIIFSSITQLGPTLCDPMECSMTGFSVHHQFSELACSNSCTESVMLPNHLILCHLLLLPSSFPSIRVFSNESVLTGPISM